MEFDTFERNKTYNNARNEFLIDPKIRFYFNQLDNLGDITNVYPTKNIDKTNVGLVKVGAKPLSGIRGLYFTKGMWKVKFLDNDYDVITCIFRYYDKETLIKSYHIAHSFLKKVILYKRQIHEDDGTVLEQLNDYQLVELDERKSKDHYVTKVKINDNNRNKRFSSLNENDLIRSQPTTPDSTDLTDVDEDSFKKKKKRLNGSIHINLVKTPSYKEKPRKLTKFESKFLKYCSYSTIDMINHIMDQNRESRLNDHGKIFNVKHKLYDINSKESQDDNKIDSNGHMFPYLNEVSRDELLRRTSLKLDIDEDVELINVKGDYTDIANNSHDLWEDGQYYLLNGAI